MISRSEYLKGDVEIYLGMVLFSQCRLGKGACGIQLNDVNIVGVAPIISSSLYLPNARDYHDDDSARDYQDGDGDGGGGSYEGGYCGKL